MSSDKPTVSAENILFKVGNALLSNLVLEPAKDTSAHIMNAFAQATRDQFRNDVMQYAIKPDAKMDELYNSPELV